MTELVARSAAEGNMDGVERDARGREVDDALRASDKAQRYGLR